MSEITKNWQEFIIFKQVQLVIMTSFVNMEVRFFILVSVSLMRDRRQILFIRLSEFERIYYNSPWYHQKTCNFLMNSGKLKVNQCTLICYLLEVNFVATTKIGWNNEIQSMKHTRVATPPLKCPKVLFFKRPLKSSIIL